MGGFTPEQVAQIVARVNERIGHLRPCVICGHNDWTFGAEVVVYHFLTDTPPQISIGGGKVLPTFPLSCVVCGNTHFLNAKMLGLGGLVEP